MTLLPLLFLLPLSTGNPLELQEVANSMLMGRPVVVHINFNECGEVNAFYTPEDRTVTLCKELLDTAEPSRLRFYFAHELAHAVIDQMDIPFTGSEEDAADEMAAVIMVDSGMAKDVLFTADYFYTRNLDAPPWDPHASDMKRAFNLKCIAVRAPKSAICQKGWDATELGWKRLLHRVTLP
jgi:hypothetical protein